MTTTVSTVPAVIVICDRCSQRSHPLDPDEVHTWHERHVQVHEKEDRRERLAEEGHIIEFRDQWQECDDSGGRAYCACGWVSREVKLCNLADLADTHLKAVEEEKAAAVA